MTIGTTELTLTRGTGTFHCPNCDQMSPYRHRNKRMFLTIYFVPLIPLKLVEEFIECSTCKQTFEPDILEMTADEIRASKRRMTAEIIRRVLVVIVAADDQVTEDELAVVQRFAQQNDLPNVSAEQMLRESAAVREAEMDWIYYIRQIAQSLAEEDKDQLVFHAFLAATAGGDLSDARQALLKTLPEAIGVTEDRFRQVVADAVEQS